MTPTTAYAQVALVLAGLLVLRTAGRALLRRLDLDWWPRRRPNPYTADVDALVRRARKAGL